MNLARAELIEELLANAGWVDDCDELVSCMLIDEDPEDVRKRCQEVDSLFRDIGVVLSENGSMNPAVFPNVEQVLDDLLNEE